MKKCMSMVPSLVIVACLLLFCSAGVYAEEKTYDWSEFDFNELDFGKYDSFDSNQDELESMFVYLETEADLSDVFLARTKSDGWYATEMGSILCRRFKKAPLTFIRALAQEDAQIQSPIVRYFPGITHYQMDEDAARLILKLDDRKLETDVERTILHNLKLGVREYWGDELPKTGDPVGSAAAALVLSGACVLVLLKKKEKR